MDITVSKSELNKSISVIQSIVEKRTTMPILANVLLSAADGKLKISASDLEITAVSLSNASVNTPGSTTVSARVFSELVRELPEGEIKIKLTEGERLEITTQKSKFKIIGISSDEYPSLPGVSFKTKGKINAAVLLEMINKTLYAVSQDETRFNLNGVCCEIETSKKEKTLKMVSTDGHRLALINRSVKDFDFKERVIIPRKGLNEIKKVIENEKDSDIGIDINEGFLIVETKDFKVSMRLIDAEYPDYNQVIPKQKGTVALIPANDLIKALRRVSLLVTDKGKGIRLDFSKDLLRINSSSPELGEANEEISINFSGKQTSVGFNAKYLLDFALTIQENQNIALEINGELGPGKFYTEQDESYFGIIMPMRLTQ